MGYFYGCPKVSFYEESPKNCKKEPIVLPAFYSHYICNVVLNPVS